MQGRMMFQPLLISSLIEHAAQFHADTTIISKNTNGSIHETNWLKVSENAKRTANALAALHLEHGDCVATLAWNNHRHLEAWYAISGSGLICHTINPRLFPEQLIFIINDAKDKAILFDKTFLPLITAIKAHIPLVKNFICLESFDADVAKALPEVKFYDELISGQKPDYVWPTFDETTASSLCYTSGTTGNPKGALFTHRSTLLHTFAACLPDSLDLSASDIILPVVPMFHVHAWGTPYAAAMVGASMILPGPGLDGDSLVNLIDEYQVTVALGVPTIWQSLLAAAKQSGSKLTTLKHNVIGGSACPPSMLATFRDVYDCETIHAWGMTEASPLGTVNRPKAKHRKLSVEEQAALRLSQGRPPFGVNVRLVDEENGTHKLPQDGETIGNVQIKGHWIIESYFGKEKNSLTEDGWFDTGDIASMDADGYLHISDRAKDLIKSGGEWISSVELENIAMGHPEIAMAAAIAADHPKWDERPVLIAVKQPESTVTEADILDYYEGKIAKWQIPDKVIFVDAIPLSGTGKMLKRKLREEFGNVLLGENA
ncbi:long-chain-fatty-acid--CoA ligase [Acinetobacter sp. 194]|uniref:long-chain-fatty-acid--CoA ligase n=1 Tax=Acinetobacter shaoyimingii TaxID=2715164 RepID=UPI00140D2638|nr:long-chain-fatty-acid--CoA ligase [Acinetobacter shaoyimingii]NHB58973.1 long-chain-fatty-acid--CoA ligase [Acinetobacter shaoyimingii]